MRAFSFDNVPIADALAPVTTLAARPVTERQIQLTWTASATATVQYLERADETPVNYKRIATLGGAITTYTDDNLPNPIGTYYYRLRTVSDISESAYSNVVSSQPLVLGAEPTMPVARLYPNPVSAGQILYIDVDRMTVTDAGVRDLLGRAVKRWAGTARSTIAIGLDNVESGLYVVDLQTADGPILRQKVVVR